jgi:hypothetical protein
VRGSARVAKSGHRTRTRATRGPKTTGLPEPILYPTVDERARIETLLRALKNWLDPLNGTPRLRFIIKWRRLKPRFARLFQPSFVSSQLAFERLGFQPGFLN